jgi:hypothetical protein
VCEQHRSQKIQCLIGIVTLFQFVVTFMFVYCVGELTYLYFLTATVLKRVVHPLLLPLLCTLSCALGSQTVIRVCIHLFNVCGVGVQAVAINSAERTV